MREAFVPILGENGAIVAQYLVTLVVILALVGLVVWVVRRYARGGAGPTARGRMPRLAIVDTLPVDNRRRLVLVRRDNVEHLVLIGGPTDIVVEPSIIRTRVAQRPVQTPANRGPAPPGASAPQPAPPPPPEPGAAKPSARTTAIRAARRQPSGVETPIPFPPRRSPPRETTRRERPAEPVSAMLPATPPLRPAGGMEGPARAAWTPSEPEPPPDVPSPEPAER